MRMLGELRWSFIHLTRGGLQTGKGFLLSDYVESLIPGTAMMISKIVMQQPVSTLLMTPVIG